MVALTIAGCSKPQQEQASQALDYGTGQTQVNAYQHAQQQIRAIRDTEQQQMDEATR